MVVLPFVERGSLSDVISEDTLQGVEFVWIVRLIAHHCTRFVHPHSPKISGISCGLAYLHSRKPPIFHGDLHAVRQ